jgi:hypothetical protein
VTSERRADADEGSNFAMLMRNARTEVRAGVRVLSMVVVWKGKTRRKIVDDKLAGGDQGIAYPTNSSASRRAVCILPVWYFLAGRRRVLSSSRIHLTFGKLRAW